MQTDFIMTMDARFILGLCGVTEQVNGIGVVLGNAGTGKTYALKKFFAGSEKAVYIKVDGLMNCRNLIRRIAEKCGRTVPSGSVWEMKDNLVEFLKENPKTLIIDEVDKLFQANSIKKVEVLRDIQEETSEFGNALILAGAPFIKDLMKRRTLRENYGQVDSRMDYIYETQGLSEKEIGSVLEGFKMDKAAHKQITSLVLKTTKGGIRWLSKILARCAELAGEETITKEVVMSACSMMLI